MKLIRYEVKYSQDEEGGWLAEFPALYGCLTDGETREEAEENALEALTGYLQSVSARGLMQEYCEPADRVLTLSPELPTALALTISLMRKKAKLSQAEAAERLEISQPSYAKWEDPNRCNATIETIGKIALAFGRRVEISFPEAS